MPPSNDDLGFFQIVKARSAGRLAPDVPDPEVLLIGEGPPEGKGYLVVHPPYPQTPEGIAAWLADSPDGPTPEPSDPTPRPSPAEIGSGPRSRPRTRSIPSLRPASSRSRSAAASSSPIPPPLSLGPGRSGTSSGSSSTRMGSSSFFVRPWRRCRARRQRPWRPLRGCRPSWEDGTLLLYLPCSCGLELSRLVLPTLAKPLSPVPVPLQRASVRFPPCFLRPSGSPSPSPEPP